MFDLFGALGVCEKFGVGPLRMQIEDMVSGERTTNDSRFGFAPKLGFSIGDLRPGLFFQYDTTAGGTQTTSAGDIDLEASPQNTNTSYPNLTYSWSLGGPVEPPRGITVSVNQGTTNARRYDTLTFDIDPDGSGEEFGSASYFIECTITTTVNGRSESVTFGRFMVRLEVEFILWLVPLCLED